MPLKITQNSLFQDPSKAVDLTKLRSPQTQRQKRADHKREFRDQRKTATAVEAIAGFDPQTEIYGFTKGQFSLLNWEKSQAVGFLGARRKPLRSHENILIAADRMEGSTYNPLMVPSGKRPGKRRPRSSATTTLYRQRGDPGLQGETGERFPRSVLRFASLNHATNNYHPTQKPVPLLEWLIRTYTNPGDLVLDFCFGSGSTAIACINTGRRFVGCEKDRTFFRRAVMRIETHLAGK